MATVSLLLRSVSKQNCADGFACRMGSVRGLQERAILGLGKHGHARSVYKWHGFLDDDAAFYRIASISCSVILAQFLQCFDAVGWVAGRASGP